MTIDERIAYEKHEKLLYENREQIRMAKWFASKYPDLVPEDYITFWVIRWGPKYRILRDREDNKKEK